jgi:predicted membrane channel-forming protein YqfA (hemolysin III family)
MVINFENPLKMDSQRKERIGPIDEHHKFLKENEFIVQGYRLYFNSVGKIFKSLFLVHNETINIWTHALGTLLFFSLFCYLLLTTEDSSASLYMRDYLDRVSFDFREARTTIFNSITTFSLELHDSEIPESLKLMLSKTKTTIEKALLLHEEVLQIPNHQVNKWPIFIYILSTIICLSFSTLYHLFNAHSHHVKIWMNSLDYAGITVMMLGSFYPPIYYIFFCDELWVVIYLSVVSCFCIIVLIVTFNPIFQGLWVRVVIFLLLGACGVLPIGHMAFFT